MATRRNYSIITRYLRVSSKYLNITRRFNLEEIIGLLQSVGYIPITKLPPPKFGSFLGGSGEVAQKDGLIVDINTDTKVIGVRGESIETMIRELQIIENEIRESLMIDLKNHFYEMLGEFEFNSGNNPISAFSNVDNFIDEELNSELGNLLVPELSLYGVKLGWKNNFPDSTKWLEVKIEPYIVRPDKAYYISLVYRNKDWSEFAEFSKNLDKMLSILVKYIEKR